MALSQSALSELLDAIRAGGSADVMRDAMTLVLQQLIELEADQAIGAGRYERTDTRTTHRNGSRNRLLSTKAGDVELRIPKLRTGSFFPAGPLSPLCTIATQSHGRPGLRTAPALRRHRLESEPARAVSALGDQSGRRKYDAEDHVRR